MIETHVHFNNDTLERDLPGVLRRATEAGVTDFIVVGFDEASSAKAVALAEKDTRIWAVVGVHPHDAKSWSEATAARLRRWATNPRVRAIGEIGLDFYRDLSPRDLQYAAFRAQLALAREVQLPVVIHCRDAYDECLALLENEAADIPLIIHCFAGELRHAETCWKHGWYLGVDGPVTYKKNDALREIVKATPAELLLLETDAPYLSPEPFRGKFPNEPCRLTHIRDTIAALRGISPTDLDALTTANARRAFSLAS
ncbi:TatD family hydrolase [Armatimonas rosea]|uniref:TatD DNase family protein n=1 Tax=Armatimonas rosea TaxID=685828 RepID=A0A7W9SQG6_ARMRO|nr:TatD family hydrolase [Armatimonas rosea]MBB6050947.1 TatD DNase family protein [Armatimonas rosea]